MNVDLFEYKYIHPFKMEKIKQEVNKFILKRDISVLPVDVVTISHFCDWLVIPYSKMDDKIKAIFDEIIYTDWGFTIYSDDKYMIFYNDSIKIGSQRFTIAHEIGHIMLEHFMHSEPAEREVEANIFASMLLMPNIVLKECKVQTIEEIEVLCGVSHSSATYKFESLNKEKYKVNVFDQKIQNQFKRFIESYKNI